MDRYPEAGLGMAAWFFVAGILFFSGSLYVLTYKEAVGAFALNWIGILTPIGGLFFIGGWLCLSLGVKYKDN
jgi:uncharacterized membrane protein YgdD (TMEM256/DUF423 family)